MQNIEKMLEPYVLISEFLTPQKKLLIITKVAHNSELRSQVIQRLITPEILAECDPITLQSKVSQESQKKILQESLLGSFPIYLFLF